MTDTPDINEYQRFYQIGGFTIQLESDLPVNENTFIPEFKHFKTDRPGNDNIIIKHHFNLPEFDDFKVESKVYKKPPWIICKHNNKWHYLGVTSGYFYPAIFCWIWIWSGLIRSLLPENNKHRKKSFLEITKGKKIHQLAVFNHDHTIGDIYNKTSQAFHRGNLRSLTLLPTDQILFARVLAERAGCIIHASGLKIDGKGFLFVGHSTAGKSTIAAMLKHKGKILCDDRIILRKWEDGYKIHGTWSHGDIPDVSSDSAPINALLFLKKGPKNNLTLMDSKREITRNLLACMIKPFTTADWWDKMLALTDTIADELPCYTLEFDKSGKVADLLEKLG